ncbi:lysostaphin resistance A-like protein [Enemella sp. A6]|uniref:CPBP family intramembrane glutamic endopeptidase n=1 Tax=Enemella sp. A6 TaxID=3440152 RepID=UPI003EB70BCE
MAAKGRKRTGNPARRNRPAANQPATPRPAGNKPAAKKKPAASVRAPGRTSRWSDRLRDPEVGTGYPLLLRVLPTAAEPAAWLRGVLGVFGALLGYAMLVPSVGMLIWVLGWSISGRGDGTTLAEFLELARAYETPWGPAGGHVGIAMLIPVSLAVVAMVHRTKPGWLWSVVRGIRWRLLGWSLLVSAVIVAAVLAVTTWLEKLDYSWQPQDGFWGFLIVIVLVTPFQAAAEEVFFRGYLMQALGSFARSPWVGVVLSALVFAAFHGVQNPALFADRLAFGLLAGVLVWRTGGLETAIAAHVINNVFAFGLATLTSSVAAARALQEITWAAAAADIAGWTVLALGLWLLAKRRGEHTEVPAAS